MVGELGPRLATMLGKVSKSSSYFDNHSNSYFLKGPAVMHPPPFPDGIKICFLPAKLPLCLKNDPSPPKLVALPSNKGDLVGSEGVLPQFQYYSLVNTLANDFKAGLNSLAGSLCTHTLREGPSHRCGGSTCAIRRSYRSDGWSRFG